MKGRVRKILKGAVCATALAAILSAALAAVMFFSDIPEEATRVLVFAIGAASAATGGFCAAHAAGSKGLITGGSVGICFYAILAAASLLIKKELSLDAHAAIMLSSSIVAGMLGGVLGM